MKGKNERGEKKRKGRKRKRRGKKNSTAGLEPATFHSEVELHARTYYTDIIISQISIVMN